MNFRGRAAIFGAAALPMLVIAYGVNGGTPQTRANAIPVVARGGLASNSTVDYHNPNWIRALVHQRIKHVFVLVQENHTFDNYFGLYPGQRGQWVENLGSPTAQADDCVPDPLAGVHACQRPFLITTNTSNAAHYVPDAPDIGGGNNSRFGQQYAIDGGRMDGFLVENEASNPLGPLPTPLPAHPTAAEVQAHNSGLNVLATYDCDTVPYLWFYAKNFALFDHYFQANTGQSTPGNVQLFAAQMGQTEVAAGKAPVLSTLTPGTDGYSGGLPLGNDSNPPALQLPFVTPYSGATASQSISVASMPVLLDPLQDAAAVALGVDGLIPDDLALETRARRPSFPWAWYQEGSYATDGTATAAFSAHHDAPLYFDYINNAKSPFGTPVNLRDNTVNRGLLSDIRSGALPSEGVFWVKGGANASTYGFKPADPALATIYVGDDDHPGAGDSDHQVAEAYVATLVNAIAASKYWKDSVIILTWDDSGGMYDHYPPPKYGPACPDDRTGTFAGTACGDGVRLPLLVISPFAKQGAVVHAPSDSGSVSKFIEDVFDLPKLASLPDEFAGTRAGLAPADANPYTSDLTDALDLDKLRRNDLWYPAREAIVPAPSVPPAMNCASLGIKPITSPGSLPPGFETQGFYSRTTPAAGYLRAIPEHDDSND